MFENVIVIDHHLGVLRILDDQINYDNLILYYNEKQSGATLAFDFFEQIVQNNVKMINNDLIKLNYLIPNNIFK